MVTRFSQIGLLVLLFSVGSAFTVGAAPVAKAAPETDTARPEKPNQDEEQPLIIDKSQNAEDNTSGSSDKRMLDVLSRLNQIEAEIRQLRGDLELITHDLKSVKEHQRELYTDVDRRLRELELKFQGKAPATSSTTKKTGGTEKTPVGPPTTGKKSNVHVSSDERTAYQQAFALMRDRRYKQSVKAFKDFLANFPSSNYSDTAQYWLAESYYLLKDYKHAVSEFGKLVQDHPESPKVVGSKVKIGLAQYELKQYSRSREVMQDVVKNHADSSTAKIAKAHLQRLGREGK